MAKELANGLEDSEKEALEYIAQAHCSVIMMGTNNYFEMAEDIASVRQHRDEQQYDSIKVQLQELKRIN